MYKSFSLYDAEKYYENGNGCICKTIKINDMTEEEINNHIQKCRKEQKEKNKIFKEKIKNRNTKKEVKELIKNIDKDEPIQIDINIPKDVKKALKKIKVKKSIKLNLDKETGNTTFILGSSKMGKTTFLMYIFKKYYQNENFINILFSENKHICLYDVDDLIKVGCYNDQCETIISLEHFINSKCNNKYKFLNIYDDIIQLKYKKNFTKSILTYRNALISSIVSTQYSKLVDKGNRTNINNILLFGFNLDESIKPIINEYLGSYFKKIGLKKMDDKILFYRIITENHGFIYLHPAKNHISYHRLEL